MKNKDIMNLLIEGSRELGVELRDDQAALFLTYLEELKAWNKKINLTSLRKDHDIITRHFLDSLIPARTLKGYGTLLDIGSGGGFPGIPLKIAIPGLTVTLMEATEKKVFFLKHIIRELGLKEIEVLWNRAESEIPEVDAVRFDCVTSRAFASVADFLAVAVLYVKENGAIIAMKGPQGSKLSAELKALPPSLAYDLQEISIPFTDRRTSLVIFKSPF